MPNGKKKAVWTDAEAGGDWIMFFCWDKPAMPIRDIPPLRPHKNTLPTNPNGCWGMQEVAEWGGGFTVDDIEAVRFVGKSDAHGRDCLLYTSPSPRDGLLSRMPSSA